MWAHNLNVVGSNPAPATNLKPSEFPMISGGLVSLFIDVNKSRDAKERFPIVRRTTARLGEIKNQQLVFFWGRFN